MGKCGLCVCVCVNGMHKDMDVSLPLQGVFMNG